MADRDPEVPGSFGNDTNTSPSERNQSLDEDEVTRRLQDVESSFMPDETFSDSPSAHKTVNRVISMATIDGYETADEDHAAEEDTVEHHPTTEDASEENSPNGHAMEHHVTVQDMSGEYGTGHDSSPVTVNESTIVHSADMDPQTPQPAPRRPQYLTSRFTSPRTSYSSQTSTGSDFTIGADYALQTGGSVSLHSNTSSRPTLDLNRSISLASIASGITEVEAASNQQSYDTVEEEDERVSTPRPEDYNTRAAQAVTPRNRSPTLRTPTDSIINERVQKLEVPGTIARKYRAEAGAGSPDGRLSGIGITPINARIQTLALKEQGNIVDKLQKENFKLKMKLYYLEKRLAQLSDEEVKRMIAENIELSTYKISTGKEVRALNKQIRELQFQLNERDARLDSFEKAAKAKEEQAAEHERTSYDNEQELSFMRDRISSYEVEIHKLHDKYKDSEAERRHLATIVKSINRSVDDGSNIELKEQLDIWKDLAETEMARKDQALEENRKLREENWQLKGDDTAAMLGKPKRHSRPTTSSEQRSGPSSTTLVEMDQLRHENAELKREVGAQTSMLRSRNREREKLYQEIEELKMERRQNGGRSTTGDSIFERSASRAFVRQGSTTSSQNRGTGMSDSEREALEVANGELRDTLSMVKMENQELTKQVETLVQELEKLADVQDEKNKLQREYDDLEEQTNQEIMALQADKDEGWQKAEDQLAEFEDLKEEAQRRIDEADDELEQRMGQIQQLEEELVSRDKEMEKLRNEVRMTSEGLEKIEADVQSKVRRIQELEMEIEELNSELETMERNQVESNSKHEKLSIELESRESQCAFMREEQDAYMMKLSELETALKTAQTSLSSEQRRVKDLENRLAEERHQHQAIGNQEKQQVQQMMNDLNREAASAKEEARKLQKAVDIKESEAKTWKDRLIDLETSLKEVLGDKTATKNGFITTIETMHRNIDKLTDELASTKYNLSNKEQLLQKRDRQLESSALETKRLTDLVDKERSAHAAEKAAHEHWQRTNQHTSNTISVRNSRITELEAARQADRRKLANLEQQLREQLHDRNDLLLTLWHRLAALCGNDWQHQNSLVNGHLPTIEVVGTKLPGFSKNLILVMKTVEGMIGGFRVKIRTIEKDLQKDYQQLEHALEIRIKRLDRLESQAQMDRISIAASAAPELAKARAENRLLKAEVGQLRQKEATGSAPAPASESSDQRWIHRLKELERRLKAEREGRLLDRNGARKRLEEGRQEIEELKQVIERMKQAHEAGF